MGRDAIGGCGDTGLESLGPKILGQGESGRGAQREDTLVDHNLRRKVSA